MICHADLISYGVHKDFLSKCGQKNKLRQGVTYDFIEGTLDWFSNRPLKQHSFNYLFIYALVQLSKKELVSGSMCQVLCVMMGLER